MYLSVTQKKFAYIGFLTALIAAFALFSVLSSAKKSNKISRFSSLNRDQVDNIQLQVIDSTTIHLQKKNNGWYLTSPINRRADLSRINILLAILSLPKEKNTYLVADLNLQEIGLDNPAGKLTLNQHIFFFGNTDASGKRRYVMHDEKITLIPDLIFPLFKNALNNTAQLHLAPAGLTGISTDNWTLHKTPNEWASDEMPNHEVENIVAAWVKQNAKDILPWPLENSYQLERANQHIVHLRYSSEENAEVSIYELDKFAIIHPIDSDYALIIDSEQFLTLSIGD